MVKGADCAAASACTQSLQGEQRRGSGRRRTKHLYLAAEATEGAGGLELPILCRPRK